MGQLADELYERSRSDDRATGWPSIVGSEIRAAIEEVTAERDVDAAGVAAWVDRCYQQQERADKAEEERDALAAEVERLERVESLAKHDMATHEQRGEHPRMSLSLMEALAQSPQGGDHE